MLYPDLDWLLDNYARWCRQSARPRMLRCCSMESGWRSPQEWLPVGDLPPLAIPIDTVSALAVNRALLHVPMPWRQLITDWHVLHRDPRRSCARLRILYRDYDDYMGKARAMLVNALTRQANVRDIPPTLPTPADSRRDTLPILEAEPSAFHLEPCHSP